MQIQLDVKLIEQVWCVVNLNESHESLDNSGVIRSFATYAKAFAHMKHLERRLIKQINYSNVA